MASINIEKMKLILSFMTKHARDTKRSPGMNFPMKRELVDDLIDAAIITFMNEPILLEPTPPITLFGDLHGQIDDLVGWFDWIGWPPKLRILCLGDYVDRGDYSLEVVCLLFVLKVLYPKDVFLLRGNHEAPVVNRTYGFYKECTERLISNGQNLYERFNHAFHCMPCCAVVGDQIMCMHGGISPDLKNLDQIRRIKRPVNVIDYGILCDLCWSDPDPELTFLPFAESMRGAGHRFSKEAAKDFCDRMKFNAIIRAHQVPPYGFDFIFGSPKDKVMTLFSAPYYVQKMNEAATLYVDEKMRCTLRVLRPKSHDSAHK